MKSLYLLRHAKSSWSDATLDDRQRPLNQRGLNDAPEMGRRLRARDECFDQVLTSPAERAHTTAELFCENCGFPPERIVVEEALYFLGRGSIEELIRQQDDAIESLMLVFHNPDITSLANALGDNGVRIDNVPTCGLLRWRCDINRWQDWSRSDARFDYFDYPKNLSGQVVRA